MSLRALTVHLEKLRRKRDRLREIIENYDLEHTKKMSQFRKALDDITSAIDETNIRAEDRERSLLKDAARREKELLKRIEELEKYGVATTDGVMSAQELENVKKASTLAIYDSIIFAISNWSTDGDAAPDFELTCQAALFPTVYERVMSGESDYYLEKVPPAADVVVQRGREYVKHFRNICNASLVDPAAWNEHAKEIQQWWVRDALPLIYGARADEWDDDVGLTLDEALEWKDQPASRALHFPLIFDGMELVEKHRDEIRDSTGLPDFNKRTLQTRLQP